MHPPRWSLKVLVAGGLLLALAATGLLAQPRARATLRLARGFSALDVDPRVYYERGARETALTIAGLLPTAVAQVERRQARPFRHPFRVYVCSSHDSFTAHIGHPPTSPVAGIAFLRDIWVSPIAPSLQTLGHELSHLHLTQQLGWWRRSRDIPAWFGEGLADWVSDRAADPDARALALSGFRAGRHMTPDAAGRLPLPKGPLDYGVSGPMLHAQARMFVDALRARDAAAFDNLVAALVDGMPFDAAFTAEYAEGLDAAWDRFLRDATQAASPPAA